MTTDSPAFKDPSRYYDEKDPQLSKQACEILTEYSGIAPEQLVTHVRTIRDRAWKLFKYPCIGNYYFLDFSISEAEVYPEVLHRLKNGEKLLDLACCFGQDVRKLVFDGAPAQNLYGFELEQGFIDLGFELFRDKDKLGGNFSSGDFFSEEIPSLDGKTFDIIHASSFFHLFSWEEQVQVVKKTVGLLKPKPGSMIFGRQIAVDKAGEVEHADTRSGSMYRHDTASFEKLIHEVGRETGKQLKVHVQPVSESKELVDQIGWYRMSFNIVLE